MTDDKRSRLGLVPFNAYQAVVIAFSVFVIGPVALLEKREHVFGPALMALGILLAVAATRWLRQRR